MRVVNVEQRDTFFIMDFPVKELVMIKDLLDHANIEYDSEKEPEMKEAVDYMHEKLYPFLNEVEEKFRGKGREE